LVETRGDERGAGALPAGGAVGERLHRRVSTDEGHGADKRWDLRETAQGGSGEEEEGGGGRRHEAWARLHRHEEEGPSWASAVGELRAPEWAPLAEAGENSSLPAFLVEEWTQTTWETRRRPEKMRLRRFQGGAGR
jgi:hypothetical protein